MDPAGSVKSRRIGEPYALVPSSLSEPVSTGSPSWTAKVAWMMRFVLTLACEQNLCWTLETKLTHLRMRTVKCSLSRGARNKPSLSVSASVPQIPLDPTHSTAKGPTPLDMFPQFPEKSKSPPSTGTASQLWPLIHPAAHPSTYPE